MFAEPSSKIRPTRNWKTNGFPKSLRKFPTNPKGSEASNKPSEAIQQRPRTAFAERLNGDVMMEERRWKK
jgi:hypothetical protein